jgi:hypothetical protein
VHLAADFVSVLCVVLCSALKTLAATAMVWALETINKAAEAG